MSPEFEGGGNNPSDIKWKTVVVLLKYFISKWLSEIRITLSSVWYQ